jgi:hypothetical protein
MGSEGSRNPIEFEPCVTFHSLLEFYSEGLLTPCPASVKLEYCPMSAVCHCVLSMSTGILHTWRPSHLSETKRRPMTWLQGPLKEMKSVFWTIGSKIGTRWCILDIFKSGYTLSTCVLSRRPMTWGSPSFKNCNNASQLTPGNVQRAFCDAQKSANADIV